jgi:hypothetical protein
MIATRARQNLVLGGSFPCNVLVSKMLGPVFTAISLPHALCHGTDPHNRLHVTLFSAQHLHLPRLLGIP